MTVIRIDGHPREEELAAYVDDTLTLELVERLEAHVLDCSVCARRLQRAASLQLVLHQAAAALEAEAPAVGASSRSPSRLRRRMGAVGTLWASAAAGLLLLCQPGGAALEAETEAPAAIVATATPSSPTEPSVTGCDPADPRCTHGLIASVDTLQSVDPLSSWPDDPFFASVAWADEAQAQGEPCGSGEDGGPLVCTPFSG
jgi:hypothetical protein